MGQDKTRRIPWSKSRPVLRYGLAVLVVDIALLLQLSLIPLIGGDPRSSPFLLFFAAVMVAAWSGGLWSGLLATLLSTLLGACFLFSGGAPGLANAAQDLRWAVFVLEGVLISALVEMMHSARRRAEAHALEVQRGEESIRLRAARLVEANEELESFSYSVSHDLRAPLRHIGGFAQMLRRRSGSSLDEVSARYLDTILSSVKHAGNLVDGLLAFSRMGRAGMRWTVVDINRLVGTVKSDLQLEVGGRTIAWKVGELPDVLGDPSMLRLVVENLLSNAVKYTRDRDRAVISVGSTYDEREATFWRHRSLSRTMAWGLI